LSYLLDVNVLIALIDSAHVRHDTANEWFDREGGSAWATCPITENGLVRILSHPKYPNGSVAPSELVAVLAGLAELPGHEFWPDDVSLRDDRWIDASLLLTAGQVTDGYLLALAVSKGGKLATFDRRLSTKAVKHGAKGLHLISDSKSPIPPQ
jgi:hypothetical protein